MPLIDVQHISKVYNSDGAKTRALKDVTLSIEKGEFVAIMGPSGSGKSTLLQILGLLDDHTDGSYHFDEKNIKSYNQDQIARMRNEKMGFIFQAFNLLANDTVLENVKLPLLYSGIAETEWDTLAKDAIRAVGLDHRMEHKAKLLSGGEKQRVAIARALVTRPDVIFADEPTGNLDSKSGQLVIETISRLNQEMGHTIILITHESYTAEYAERIVKLHDGEIVTDSRVHKRRTHTDAFVK